MRNPVREVVFVVIGVHPGPLLPLRLVVLGTGQGRQKEEFKDVDWQFALDYFDVVQDRFLAVAGEAKNVAGESQRAVGAPLLQHLAVIGTAASWRRSNCPD